MISRNGIEIGFRAQMRFQGTLPAMPSHNGKVGIYSTETGFSNTTRAIGSGVTAERSNMGITPHQKLVQTGKENLGKIMKKVCIIITVFLLSSCSWTAKGKYMSTRETPFEPVAGKAMVYIFRTDIQYYNFRIWDGENLIAVMETKSYTQYIADSGKHTFLAGLGPTYLIIEANLAADKTYYLNSSREGFNVIPRFTVIKKGDERWEKIPKWKKEFRRIEPIEEKLHEREDIMRQDRISNFEELKTKREELIKEGRLNILIAEDGV